MTLVSCLSLVLWIYGTPKQHVVINGLVFLAGVEETPLWIPRFDALDVDGTRQIPPYFLGVPPVGGHLDKWAGFGLNPGSASLSLIVSEHSCFPSPNYPPSLNYHSWICQRVISVFFLTLQFSTSLPLPSSSSKRIATESLRETLHRFCFE